MSLPSAASANIARHLPLMAARQPDTAALKVPRGRTSGGRIDYLTLSYAELAAEVAAWQAAMTARGVRRGDRTLVMVRPGLPLIAAVFALFGLGAVPVVIDPGMGRKSFLACVARSRPRALVGIPLARLVSRVFPRAFASVEVRVPASGKPTARLAGADAALRSPARARRDPAAPAAGYIGSRSGAAPSIVASASDDLAAVLFTSGSTGAPKGVCYTHGMFDAQVRLIRDAYGIQPGEVDLPMLPIFALFNPALGMTTVVPEIDPSRPAQVDPAKIVQAIRQEGVTNSFGSPTLWRKIAAYCDQHDIALPGVRRVLSAGAPVPPELWTASRRFLPDGELHSPYGATEVLPVSTISAREVLEDTAATLGGRGTCVGRVIAGNTVKIIALTDAPLASLRDARELPPGEIGEIIVSGPTVTREYDQLPEATALAKIQTPNLKLQTNPNSQNPARASGAPDSFGVWDLAFGISAPPGAVWHRMGDCGYLDAAGRLWFCGRKAERVETPDGPLFTEQVEPVFNAHDAVRRCALVGLGEPGRQRPAVIVEPVDADVVKSSERSRRLARELRQLALQQPHLARRINLFYFHPAFPVDVRHNAKIHRLTLARWAHSATGYESDPKR